ncbi:hypothetical protein CBA19CS22_17210 [Caballeronia novacaledonica]|jgi:hypothetical protein|uniref:Uncharacterized protein n=1 Tax=Caballeronia novacaledonica TaxID=1544861 RepID=A0ACB5QT09_9BURK|nr:hypothetical protein [Caballeronia novacaledonica]GJH10383.1 hypothetical protein CBA19CS11_16115 [Caballeronia novacaledonica]GJH18306.1 hypothetical protein CBA19CS22_17210 [Caballeronia novacaledonica]
MDTASELASGPAGHTPESLKTLAAYLEVSLEKGKCVVMMRRGPELFAVYIGNPGDEDARLTPHGTISTAMAEELLESTTHVGLNWITVGDQKYRFFRSFTYIDEAGAVVFAPT